MAIEFSQSVFTRTGIRVDAVDQTDSIACLFQNGADVKKPQRSHPQIERGEIMNPWIDQQDSGGRISSLDSRHEEALGWQNLS